MEFSFKNERLKVLTILLLLAVAVVLTYCFHFILKDPTIFTHFFYIPIILATLWWKRKGMIVPVFLAIFLVASDVISGTNAMVSDLFRAMMFLIIGIIVSILSEEISFNKQKHMESENKFRSIAQTAVEGIITTDQLGKIAFVNESILNIFGYREIELMGKDVGMIVPDKFKEEIQHILEAENPSEVQLLGKTLEAKGLRKDGTEFPMEASIATWTSSGENYFSALIRDVSQRQIMEEKKNELAAIVKSSDNAIIGRNLDGIITSWNRGAERIFGYTEEEALGTSMSEMIPTGYEEELPELIDEIDEGNKVKNYETKRLRKDGEIIDISLTISSIRDANGNIMGSSSISQDITQKKKMEKQLKQSLKDKDMLIGEIHHRVKNNLMIITSLLSLQSSYIDDQESRTLFEESENRTRSMALIHEKLYQSGEAKRIDFEDYIRSLGNELYRTYAVNPNINMEIDLQEGLILDVDTAIPLGLIFNELFTNTLKHAFPNNKKGTILVSFHKFDGNYQLIVEDDGVGLPEEFKLEESDSFGLRLVDALTQQIDAKVDLDTSHGTKFVITFKENM